MVSPTSAQHSNGNAPKIISRHAVIILGMHRSGTSALARVINLLGADLPSNLMAAGEGNENGHWESQAIANFNDEILFSAGSRWNDWLPLAPSWHRSAIYDDFFERACELIQNEYGRSPLFVMKDPRICRLAPFWLDVLESLDIRPAIILPQRNPLEVTASLSARDGSEMGLGLLLWLRHVLDAEVSTRGKARCFITFTQLLDDWAKVVNVIEHSVNLSFPRRSVLADEEIASFLLKDTKHENERVDAALSTSMPVWVRDAFAIFLRWSETGEDSQDFALLDDIRSAFDMASPSFAQFLAKGVGLGHGHGSESLARRELKEVHAHMAALEDSLAQARQQVDASTESMRTLALEKEVQQYEAQQLLDRINTLDKAYQDKLHEADEANAALSEALSLLEEQKLEAEKTRIELQAVRADLERQYDLALQQEERQCALEQQWRNRINTFESALIQRQEEAAQAWAEADTHRLAQVQLQSALANEQRRIPLLEGQIKDLQSSVSEYSEELFESREEIDRLNAVLRNSVKENSDLNRQINLLQSIMATNAQERVVANSQIKRLNIVIGVQSALVEKANAESRQILSDKDQESKALHLLKKDNGSLLDRLKRTDQDVEDQRLKIKRSNNRAEWLLAVALKLQRSPAWWLILPAKKREERVRRMVERNGLFNGAAYLARYPDVRASGMDPLVHYMRHGIREDRSW